VVGPGSKRDLRWSPRNAERWAEGPQCPLARASPLHRLPCPISGGPARSLEPAGGARRLTDLCGKTSVIVPVRRPGRLPRWFVVEGQAAPFPDRAAPGSSSYPDAARVHPLGALGRPQVVVVGERRAPFPDAQAGAVNLAADRPRKLGRSALWLELVGLPGPRRRQAAVQVSMGWGPTTPGAVWADLRPRQPNNSDFRPSQTASRARAGGPDSKHLLRQTIAQRIFQSHAAASP
jgi:hypothetical protein